MDAWWGDGARRQKSLTLATTLYAAGAGNVEALPGLASLAVDRTEGAVVRASALEYIGRLAGARSIDGTPAQSQTSTERGRPAATLSGVHDGRVEPKVLSALFGAASDPEPMVRAAAVRALGTLDQRDARVVSVLMARLVDDARVVRVRAAESLLGLDVFTAPGRAGAALANAQLEMIESLRSFPESATQQAALAWLLAQRGEVEAAERAVQASLLVDPTLARPYVIRGVLAARAGKFGDAVASWKAARERDPQTPNIDRMIEEATRRGATPPR